MAAYPEDSRNAAQTSGRLKIGKFTDNSLRSAQAAAVTSRHVCIAEGDAHATDFDKLIADIKQRTAYAAANNDQTKSGVSSTWADIPAIITGWCGASPLLAVAGTSGSGLPGALVTHHLSVNRSSRKQIDPVEI